MQYSFRCILDVETDVIRDISINADATLEELHKSISNAYGFSTQEMAAFYRTDEEWEQGEEIPLINMNTTGHANEMKDYKLSEVFSEMNNRLLYIYDFLDMWTFFIELRKIDTNLNPKEPKLVYSLGELPIQAPEKNFISENISDDFNDEFGDELEDDFDGGEDGSNFY